MTNDCFLGTSQQRPSRLAQVHQPSLQRRSRRLRSVGYAKLAEDVIDVTLDGCFTDTQAGSYFFIALTAHNELEDFHFSTRQIRAGHSLDQPLGDGCRYVARSGVNRPDCRFE